MKNFETLKNMKELLTKAQAAVPKIESAISAAIGRQAELDEFSIRAEALEAKDLKQRSAAASENKEAIPRLQAELEAAKKKAKIIEEEVRKLEGPAVKDIQEKYRPQFDAAVREFFEQAERAAGLERKIRETIQQAEREVWPLLSFPRTIFATLPWLLIDNGDSDSSPIHRYRKEAKEEGIPLESK